MKKTCDPFSLVNEKTYSTKVLKPAIHQLRTIHAKYGFAIYTSIVAVSQSSDGQHFYHINQAFLGNEFILYVDPDYLAKYNPVGILFIPAWDVDAF